MTSNNHKSSPTMSNKSDTAVGNKPKGPTGEYGAKDIKVLRNLDAVRRRPAMYIGDTATTGLHHLVHEVIDNSIDEVMGGYCGLIDLVLYDDGSVSVLDDGRGIPVDMHPEEKKPGVEVAMTILHAGGKFDRQTYKVSGGLHGVGVSVVNALSEWLEVEVYRDGKVYFQKFERGKTASPLKERGTTKRHGTKVTFKPDSEIFPETEFSYDLLANRLREMAYLNSDAKIRIKDERTGKKEEFAYSGGIKAFVKHLNESKTRIHTDIICLSGKASGNGAGEVEVEIALQYNNGYSTALLSFVNNIHTREGGTHLTGLKSAITRTFNAYARKADLLKEKDRPPTGDDFLEGLTCVLNVRVPEPQFEGQTKTKLGNSEVQGIVEAITNEQLGNYLEEHPPTARAIVRKAIDAHRAREAARKALALARRATVLSSGNLPGKLADCSSKDVESTELFIVEGDSAGGSAKMARDRRYQAVLPIQGKILNVEKARDDVMLNHEKIKLIISALGTGIGSEHFDPEKLRYGKIIIMTDADVDGSHIRTLLLTFFFRKMNSLIGRGRIYIAQPPLYRIQRKKRERYVRTDGELMQALLQMGVEGASLEVGEKAVKGRQLKELLDLLAVLAESEKQLQRKGISLSRFVSLRDKNGALPELLLRFEGADNLFYGEEELQAFIEKASSEKNVEIETADLDIAELHQGRDIDRALEKLGTRGFTLEDYLPDESGKPRFRLLSDGEEIELHSLKELVEAVASLVRKGLDIQRYKGLGEMNPGQLWETTMNPETRTLRQVRIEDDREAEERFSTLMGTVVECRRRFIQRHALEVKNLDI